MTDTTNSPADQPADDAQQPTPPEPTDRRDPAAQAAFHRKRASEIKAEAEAAATAHAAELEALRADHAAALEGLARDRDAAREEVRGLSVKALSSQVDGIYEFEQFDAERGREMHFRVHFRNPSDLFEIGGHEAADFLDEAGNLDRDRVTEAVATLHAERPYLFRIAGGALRRELMRGGPVPRTSGGQGGGWGDKIHPTPA